MNEDYFIFNRKQFQGHTPLVGKKHTLASRSIIWPDQVTLNMAKINNLLLNLDL